MAHTIKTRLFTTVKVSLLTAMLCVAVDAMVFSSSTLYGAKRVLALLSLGSYFSCVGLLLRSELNKWTNYLTLDEKTQSKEVFADAMLHDISLWLITGGTTMTIGYSYNGHLLSAMGAVLTIWMNVQSAHVVGSLLLTLYSAVLCMFRPNTLTVEFFVLMTGSTLIVPVWFLGGVSRAAVGSGMTLPSCGVIVVGLIVQSYGIFTLTRSVLNKPDDYEEIEIDESEL